MSQQLETIKLGRRDLLKWGFGAGAGLVLGVGTRDASAQAQAKTALFSPLAFVQLAGDGTTTIWFTRSEVGQGIMTALPMMLADEMEADWSKVVVKQAPFDPKFGDQNTAGSNNVRASWEPLRKAGAQVRQTLLETAAARWNVAPDACRAANGVVTHGASGRKFSYGELAAEAAKRPLATATTLKKPEEFRLIGKPVHRVDTPAKTDGSAVFSMDIRVPGMLYAVIARPPMFGGKVGKVDDAKAKRVPGVKHVVQVPSGVAVVATTTWQAIQGRDALQVTWDESGATKENSADLKTAMEEATQKAGTTVRKDGDPAAGGAKTIEAVYDVPWQAHAPMEPINCTARVTADSCEVWAPTQVPSWAFTELTRVTGLPREKIHLHIDLIGGAFGRGIIPDFVVEAAQVSKAAGAPVKVVYTREDDLQHDFYRPPSLHRMRGAVDAEGWPVAWSHHLSSPPIATWLNPNAQNVHMGEVGGAADMPYAIPNVHVAYSPVESKVPRGWWRSVEHAPNAYAVECFLDELAAAGGKDPLELRRRLLAEPRKLPSGLDTARLKRVLDLAAEKAGWGRKLPARQGMGLSCHYSFRSYVAQVAEVAVNKDGEVEVRRVVCAVDPGVVVNPDTVAAQMQGGICFGLTAALKSAITIENGRVAQSNFHNYKMLHINEMPKVEVHIVPSGEAPGGIGEPGVPPLTPALCNALFAATGVRVRSLPVRTRALRQRS
jgi:isoquinoline 1-oxidoreductase beta subunit